MRKDNMLGRDKMPYLIGKPELYAEDDTEEMELRFEREREEKPYVGKLLEIREPNARKGKSTTILKKMIKDMQTADLEPMQTIGSTVVGNLFDRVRFLKERVAETEAAIRARKTLNERFNAEIDKDVEEMEKMIVSLADKEDIREFKLNVSLLRMEKRKEDTSFWRDTTTLKNQLQELSEQLEVESKISELFSDLNM